jgi:hypothetical protein
MKILLSFLALASAVYAQQGTLMSNFMSRYAAVKLNLIETAEVMPEANYSFKLTDAQRPFSGWIEHTAGMNYANCSAIQGKPAPAAAKHSAPQSKAELVKELKDSFDFCDAALKGMTDDKALAEVTIGEKKVYPVGTMIGMIGGLNEHYGNLVGYLRKNGITPPSTARTAKK